MFDKVGVPILGLVQNMSSYTCTKCGHTEHLFGKDGAKNMATDKGIELIGDIPLHMSIRETSDSGKPIVISEPDSSQGQAFLKLAEHVVKKLPKYQDPLSQAN